MSEQAAALMLAGSIGAAVMLTYGLIALVDFFIKIAGR